MCDPISMTGGLMKNAYDKRKERKQQREHAAYVEQKSKPVEQFTTTKDTSKEKTKMNTGVNIGGRY